MMRGKLLLHEHPAQAGSWSEESITDVSNLPEVDVIKMDQCQFGQQTPDEEPIKKETKWMSTCPEILQSLNKQCSGRGGVCSTTGSPHAICSGEVAKMAALYKKRLATRSTAKVGWLFLTTPQISATNGLLRSKSRRRRKERQAICLPRQGRLEPCDTMHCTHRPAG